MPFENLMLTTIGLIAFLTLLVWSMVWKGIALWRAGRNNQLAWFIILLIVNTIGILEILYIFIFQKDMNKQMRKKNK